ncbi:CTTNBP2 [Symbiodinium sp. CCMP2592]|nr:CTTNBP2 [Symbiodinium sp. CCMP2592]
MEFLLLRRADPDIESPESQGGSALCVAAAQGEYAAVAHLLSTRANPNFRSPFTAPPLVLACRQDEPDTAQLLLQARAHTGEPALRGLHLREIEFITRKSWTHELLLGHIEQKTRDSRKATWTPGRFAKRRRRLKQKASPRGSGKIIEIKYVESTAAGKRKMLGGSTTVTRGRRPARAETWRASPAHGL